MENAKNVKGCRAYLDPKFFIQCASNQTSFKKYNNPLLFSTGDFKVNVLSPSVQLNSL